MISVKQSDGGAIWGMPTAVFRFGMEGGLSSSAATGHTTYLCRYVLSMSHCLFLVLFCSFFFTKLLLFLPVARLYLTGSSMNGLGCRSSDADLCLVIRGTVSIYGSALFISSKWMFVKCTLQPQTQHLLPNTHAVMVFASERNRSSFCPVSPQKVIQNTL